ncbi:hypothetical protein [Janibacter limosus]|jgi:hypothetical protein|uniref:DUF485 domain-containing protein n=1 Tax=Janibacter limosus TaxID=53458 RepID=A0A4P6MR31_9MICO|nr:hypothetical protein [Janibacter limosus]QBF45032.1 hypothetical protein EXU32_01365 [Janibacter limosus]
MSTPPVRVRVTRTRRPSRHTRPRTVRDEIAGNSQLGTAYVSSLVRAQLQLSLGTLAFGAVTLGALPLLFALVPATRRLSILDLPVPWIVLGALVYPGVVLTAWWYTRSSERIEAEFGDLVGRR